MAPHFFDLEGITLPKYGHWVSHSDVDDNFNILVTNYDVDKACWDVTNLSPTYIFQHSSPRSL